MRRLTLLALLAMLLTACDGPRTTVTTRSEANAFTDPLRLKVLKVWYNDRMEWSDEPHISHVIDVEVLDGPEGSVGKILSLPYDYSYVVLPPPLAGDVVVTAPADWVKQNRERKPRPFGR
jgi:hypothetical protein